MAEFEQFSQLPSIGCAFDSRSRTRVHLTAITVLASVLTILPSNGDDIVWEDNFTSFYKDDNPWGCVDGLGQIKLPAGRQLEVDDNGTINGADSSPSIAVGDLNGDGLPDLVVGDAMGFFWYFKNQGTKTVPLFTSAEMMPLWLGDACPDIYNRSDLVVNNVVPRIQLIDLAGEGKLDLIVGNYLGKLFYLHNQGSRTSPVFKVPSNLDDITVPTQKAGALWCNYLAPFLYDWRHNGVFDLLIGDGSYSANSIYLQKNTGSNEQPSFSETNRVKIIPGMGREQLVPQVVSWNGDGKADILATERAGFLNIFLNQTGDQDAEAPVFDHGHHVLVGGQEMLGERATVTMADLTGSGLPGLVIATADGHVSFSQNVGTATNFQFGAPAPIKLASSKPKILRPYGWSLDGGFGSPYDLLVCTNAQVEPKFSPPEASGVSTALRFYRDVPLQPDPTFRDGFYPKTDTRIINHNGSFSLKADTRYTLSFWVKASDQIADMKYVLSGLQPDPNNPDQSLGRTTMTDEVDTSGEWQHFTAPLRFESLSDDKRAEVPFDFHLEFSGTGSLYIAAIKLQEDE